MRTIDQDRKATLSAEKKAEVGTAVVERIIGDLMAVIGELRCRGTQRLVQQAVSMTHLHVMWLLEHHPSLTMGHLAEMLGVSMSNATGLIDRMEERGLVERIRVPDDRRIVEVQLSAEGRAMLEDIEILKATMVRKILGRLNHPQLERLSGSLDDVRKAIQSEITADPDEVQAVFGLHHHTH